MNDLVEKLLRAKDTYYNSLPIMSDEEFDKLEETLRSLDPDNSYFSMVGTNVKGSNKIKHQAPMLSCGKAKTVDEVKTWLKKINCEKELLCVMAKIDGLSATIKYLNGEVSYISTRGDGKIGQDITHLKEYLNIPQFLGNKTLEIRGEIYLPRNTELSTNGKPLRNVAVGIVNRKSDKKDCKFLKFIAYNIIGLGYTNFSQSLFDLKESYFDVVEYVTLFFEELEEYRDIYLESLRDYWLQETDGLVIQIDNIKRYEEINSKYLVEHHNYYNIALKPPAQGKETILKNIEWSVSKEGNMIPVAIFDIIDIGGRNINRATLNNYENVINLKLKKGDKIEIELANEVIPYFKRIIELTGEKDTALIPQTCPSCGGSLIIAGVHLKCLNKECREQVIKVLTSYCEDCEMDGISSKTIEFLYDKKLLKSIIDLYSLEDIRSTLIKFDRFGKIKVDNLLFQIEKSKKQNIVQFISRIGIEGLGEKGVINLGIKTRKEFLEFKDQKYVNGKSIIEFKNNNKEFVDKMLEIVNPRDMEELKMGEKVCMTGTDPWKKGRKVLTEELTAMGYEEVDGVTKTTNVLVCEDINGDSSKLVKARKLGIKIVSYEEFFVKN